MNISRHADFHARRCFFLCGVLLLLLTCGASAGTPHIVFGDLSDNGDSDNCFIRRIAGEGGNRPHSLPMGMGAALLGLLALGFFLVIRKRENGRQAFPFLGLFLLLASAPVSGTAHADSMTFSLRTGINGISIPFEESGITTASGLMAAVPGCDLVQYWDVAAQDFVGFQNGGPVADFPLLPGYPYFVRVAEDTEWTVSGTAVATPDFPLTLSETTGINVVALPPSLTDPTTAEDLVKQIPNCDAIWRWDAEAQGFSGHPGGTAINDFPLRAGRPYFVNVTAAGTWQPAAQMETDDDGDGFSEKAGDCNDSDPEIYPNGIEICDDGADNDCDTKIDCGDTDCITALPCLACTDGDADGYPADPNCGAEIDCNDGDAAVNPGADENCADGTDNDCDTKIDCTDPDCAEIPSCIACTDADGDGYFAEAGCGGSGEDCDDENPDIHPGGTETCGDGLDQDCSGEDDPCTPPPVNPDPDTEIDNDGDGVSEDAGDCDDQNDAVRPGAVEICDDAIDNDCDGTADCSDADCGADSLCVDPDRDDIPREIDLDDDNDGILDQNDTDPLTRADQGDLMTNDLPYVTGFHALAANPDPQETDHRLERVARTGDRVTVSGRFPADAADMVVVMDGAKGTLNIVPYSVTDDRLEFVVPEAAVSGNLRAAGPGWISGPLPIRIISWDCPVLFGTDDTEAERRYFSPGDVIPLSGTHLWIPGLTVRIPGIAEEIVPTVIDDSRIEATVPEGAVSGEIAAASGCGLSNPLAIRILAERSGTVVLPRGSSLDPAALTVRFGNQAAQVRADGTFSIPLFNGAVSSPAIHMPADGDQGPALFLSARVMPGTREIELSPASTAVDLIFTAFGLQFTIVEADLPAAADIIEAATADFISFLSARLAEDPYYLADPTQSDFHDAFSAAITNAASALVQAVEQGNIHERAQRDQAVKRAEPAAGPEENQHGYGISFPGGPSDGSIEIRNNTLLYADVRIEAPASGLLLTRGGSTIKRFSDSLIGGDLLRPRRGPAALGAENSARYDLNFQSAKVRLRTPGLKDPVASDYGRSPSFKLAAKTLVANIIGPMTADAAGFRYRESATDEMLALFFEYEVLNAAADPWARGDFSDGTAAFIERILQDKGVQEEMVKTVSEQGPLPQKDLEERRAGLALKLSPLRDHMDKIEGAGTVSGIGRLAEDMRTIPGEIDFQVDFDRLGSPTPYPAEGHWEASLRRIAVKCPKADKIVANVTSETGGGRPADPAEPTLEHHEWAADGTRGEFEFSADAGEYKRISIRFRGYTDGAAGPVSPVYTYTIDRSGDNGGFRPGLPMVSPESGQWNESPQTVNVIVPEAEKIYCFATTAGIGETPVDPPKPTAESHTLFDPEGTAFISGEAGQFAITVELDTAKQVKVRFRGWNQYGYGPPSRIYTYSIDRRSHLPGPVRVLPPNDTRHGSPLNIIALCDNAERIYAAATFSAADSDPPDPPEPTVEKHTPVNGDGDEFIEGTSGRFSVQAEAEIRQVKIRFRGWNEKGYGPVSPIYRYIVDPAWEPPSEETYTNSLGMIFRRIPGGTFIMGSPPDELGSWSKERPQHEVTLTEDFYMMTTEVTQAHWETVMGENPSHFSDCGGDCPVEKVSWHDVQEFIDILNAMEGNTYRLPTEAEWEYAARAGTTTAFYSGKITQRFCSPADPNLDKIGWYCGNDDVDGKGTTHPAAQKQPNDWGLYDMSGNVWEWCQDWYGTYPPGPVTDPTGPKHGSGRVIRGGGWYYGSQLCRSATRYDYDPGTRYNGIGFRLVLLPGR